VKNIDDTCGDTDTQSDFESFGEANIKYSLYKPTSKIELTHPFFLNLDRGQQIICNMAIPI
jgi:hypothetical protein